MTINIDEIRLEDGSTVYNVVLDTMTLHAVTLDDAVVLASKIRDAVECHTNDVAVVR